MVKKKDAQRANTPPLLQTRKCSNATVQLWMWVGSSMAVLAWQVAFGREHV